MKYSNKKITFNFKIVFVKGLQYLANLELQDIGWGYGDTTISQRDFNPLMLTAAKTSLTILMKSSGFSTIGKIFEGEMLIRTLPTTLLQIFCKIILNSKVIVKSIIDPDDNSWMNSLSFNGLDEA